MRFNTKEQQRFSPDTRNLLDAGITTEGREIKNDRPGWLKDAENVARTSLFEHLEQGSGWPEFPQDVRTVDELMQRAQYIVTEHWRQAVQEKLKTEIAVWVERLEQIKNQEGQDVELIDSLIAQLEPKTLETNLEIKRIGGLEDLQTVGCYDIWLTLNMLSAERQMAVIQLLNKWTVSEELTDEKCEVWGMKKSEIKLYIQLAAVLTKYIDQAYIKQVELANTPGGREGSEATGIQVDTPKKQSGMMRLYSVVDANGQKQLLTYAEVFPELKIVANRLRAIATKVKNLLENQQIPDTYKKLPDYLSAVADVYGGHREQEAETPNEHKKAKKKEKNPKDIENKWRELQRRLVDLANDNCPLLLALQYNAGASGAANKIDIEMRLGLTTPELRNSVQILRTVERIAQQVNEENLEEPNTIPEGVIAATYITLGSNLNFATRGESLRYVILNHPDVIKNIATLRQLPVMRKLFGSQYLLDEQTIEQHSTIKTATHEVAHAVMDENENREIETRLRGKVGTSEREKNTEWAAFKELKADVMSVWLLQKALERNEIDETFYRNQFYAELANACDYQLYFSGSLGTVGEGYKTDGMRVLHTLLEKGVLVKQEDVWVVTDAKKGMDVIAEIGQELMDKFLTNQQATSNELSEYIKASRAFANREPLREFLSDLTSASQNK